MCPASMTPSSTSSRQSAPTPTRTPIGCAPNSPRLRQGWQSCRRSRSFPRVSGRDVDGSVRWRPPMLWRVVLRLSPYAAAVFMRLRVTGDVPDDLRNGPLLLAANHVGAFDPFVLIAACARRRMAPRFLATGGLFRAPLFGALMRATGHLRVDRRHPSVADALPVAHSAVETG